MGEFSYTKNISNHFDRELKTPSNAPTENVLFHQYSRAIFIPSQHLQILYLTKEIITVLPPYEPKLEYV